MNIVVCIKEVGHLYGRIGNDTRQPIEPSNIVYILNPWDAISVEEALKIKEKVGEGKVTVIAVAPARAEKALRECLAMGADEAIRIWDDSFKDSDAYVTTLILSKALNQLTFDLVFLGSDSLDTHGGEMGGMLAERLGTPFISGAVRMELMPNEKSITVHRCLERGDREILACKLPATVTVEKGLNTPRYPTHVGRLKSWEKPIELWDRVKLRLESEEIGLTGSPTKVLGISPPRPRTRKALIPDSSLSAEARMQLLMSGGIEEKKDSNEIEGDFEEVASKVIQILIEEKVIKNNQA